MSERSSSQEEREAFKKTLEEMTVGEIAEARYSGVWGNYDKNDPNKSSWKVRMANRHLAGIERGRQQRPQQIGNLIQLGSLLISIVALIVAILAYLNAS